MTESRNAQEHMTMHELVLSAGFRLTGAASIASDLSLLRYHSASEVLYMLRKEGAEGREGVIIRCSDVYYLVLNSPREKIFRGMEFYFE